MNDCINSPSKRGERFEIIMINIKENEIGGR